MNGIPVRGTVRRQCGGPPLLVLDRRLDGYDTFLQARLVLDQDGTTITVRVHTFDDLTVLHPIGAVAAKGAWSGRLVLRVRRPVPVPDDLAEALASAGASLDGLDDRERRHLLGYLADATDPVTRRCRIVTILAGLHGLTA
jgi:hypothetical protein